MNVPAKIYKYFFLSFIALMNNKKADRAKNIAIASISARVFFIRNGEIANKNAEIKDIFSLKNSFVKKYKIIMERDPNNNAANLEVNCVAPRIL